MQYFLLYSIFALWVLFDALSRKMAISTASWAIGTGILGPIVLPFYLASRPLKRGEVREGGKAWNILKNFAILWTIVMAIASIIALLEMARSTTDLVSGAARAGAGIGIVVAMGILSAVWFLPTMGAAVTAFLLKNNTVVEVGPTGQLVGQNSAVNVLGGWAGLTGVAMLALIALGVNGLAHSSDNKSSAGQSDSADDVTDVRVNSGKVDASASVASRGWHVRRHANAMDAGKEADVSLDASNEIAGVIGSYTPTLTVQCGKRKPEVVIDLGNQIQSSIGEYDTYLVRVKFDDAKPAAQRWIGATNGEALFSPNPSQ